MIKNDIPSLYEKLLLAQDNHDDSITTLSGVKMLYNKTLVNLSLAQEEFDKAVSGVKKDAPKNSFWGKL